MTEYTIGIDISKTHLDAFRQADQTVQQRRFARPVRADQRDPLAATDRQVHAAQDFGPLRIGLAQAAGADHRLGRWRKGTGGQVGGQVGGHLRQEKSALADVATRAPEVAGAVNRLAKVAIGNAITLFAHDETSPEMRAENRALGITVSEFLMTEATAHAARLADEPVVFGAPNVLRGGSQNDAVDATPAIRAGLGTVLATDYYYPAPLRAAFILARDHGVPFAAAWDCVSANAAAAAGLGDRGRLRPGQRADVIAVCPQTCTVKAVFVAGERKLGLA